MSVDENLTALFAKYGKPSNSRELGLAPSDSYNNSKDRHNYKSKGRAYPVIVVYNNGTIMYEKGEIVYTTIGTIAHFLSVMNTQGKGRRRVSLHNAVLILRINEDFTTEQLFPAQTSS
jgi:hypothetical protein